MPQLQTGTVIDKPTNPGGGSDFTSVGLSTFIVAKINGFPIGAIQQLSVTEQRTIMQIDEIGTDGHVDSAPSRSTNITGEIRRIRLNRLRIAEAMGRGYLHVHAQRIPFDIDISDTINGDGASAIITTIRNVWIDTISYSYNVDNWIIMDDLRFQAEAIYSTIAGTQNASTGGIIGSQILQINSIERLADVGGLRGSMSAPALINDFFSNV